MADLEISRRALELFETLADADPADRRRRLEDASAREPLLAARVRELLAADAGQGLEVPAPSVPTPSGAAPRSGDRLGPWQLARQLGQGGMGTVWEGLRVEGGFAQQVAIKLLRELQPDSNAERRFLFEREILGRLRHPSIARILHADRTPQGAPYLVMEYVEGERIDRYCDSHRLDVRERVRLVAEIARAVAHAHRNLVIHRDLKPANILVDETGRPRLLDFGIAKLLEDDRAGAALTVGGLGPMTPEYASPEQIRGQPIATPSDVYSLGVVLYELLVGRTPFGRAGSPADLVRLAAEGEATPPSRVLAESDAEGDDLAELLRARGATSPIALRRQLQGDLDRIVLHALRTDPERRYPGMEAFAADLDAWLSGLPVRARGDSVAYRTTKFLRRHWLPVAAAIGVVSSLAAGLGVAVAKAGEARAERARAEEQSRRTEEVNRFLVDLVAAPAGRWWRDFGSKGPETRVIDVIDEAAAWLDTRLEDAPLQRAALHQTLNDTYLALGLPDRAEVQVRRALEIRRRELGSDHPSVAESTYYLAATLRDQSRFGEALRAYRAALAIERGLPEPTPNLPFALAEAAATAARIGQHGEVEELMDAALREARRRTPAIEGYLLAHRAWHRAERGDLAGAGEGLAAAERWCGSATDHPAGVHESSRPARILVHWLRDELREADEASREPASAGVARARARVLFDADRFEESRRLLDDPATEVAGSASESVLLGLLHLHLDRDAPRCLAAVEPIHTQEQERSRGPTWILAEARAALALCLAARGGPGDGERAALLAGSAREALDELFDRPTPLHRRLAALSH